MEISIRRARGDDAVELAAFIQALGLFPWLDGLDPADFSEQVAANLSQPSPDAGHTIYVARDGQTLVGYVAVHWLPYLILSGPEGYISEMFVREDVRGAGVGSLLFEAVEREADKRGCSRLSLLNRTSRESYQRAFYPKKGFFAREDMVNFILPLPPARD